MYIELSQMIVLYVCHLHNEPLSHTSPGIIICYAKQNYYELVAMTAAF